jgi:hypothetical protein
LIWFYGKILNDCFFANLLWCSVVIGFLLFFAFGQEVVCWLGRLLLRLGLKSYDLGERQVKAHQKRAEDYEAMLQNPKQMLVRASQAETNVKRRQHGKLASGGKARRKQWKK